jgi:hypothetical protein
MDSVLIQSLVGTVRLRYDAPPQGVDVSSFWGGGFPIAGGCVVYDGEDPRDLGRAARMQPHFLAPGATVGVPFAQRWAHLVVGSPGAAHVWLVEQRDGDGPGGLARRVHPRTGEVLGEHALPDDADVAGATDDCLVLNRAGIRVTVWEPATRADLLTVPGFATYAQGRYVALVPRASYDPQPHAVLDTATGEVRQAGLPLARFVTVSPDGRWLAGPDDGEHPVLRAAEVGTGREVVPRNGRVRRTWFTPAVRWSRDGATAYVVPHTEALLRWRPGETDLELVSELPSAGFLLVE